MSFLPVRLKTLKQNITLGFELYIQLPHKIIKYIDAVDFIDSDQINSLKSKKIRKLYIKDADESHYQAYLDRCLSETLNDQSLSIEDKSELLVAASETNVEKILNDPHSQKSYETAQSTAMRLIDALSSSDDMLKGIFGQDIENEQELDARMYKHAINTSSLCISFSEYLGIDKHSVELLGIAGLFHDMAYNQYSDKERDLFFKQMEQMTTEELKKYKEHPRVAAEILQDKDFASKEVINFILVHEERQKGNGFPKKIAKLDLKQEIIALCAYYDRKVTCFNQTREDVLKDLAISQLGNFELDTINKFKTFAKKVGL